MAPCCPGWSGGEGMVAAVGSMGWAGWLLQVHLLCPGGSRPLQAVERIETY